MYQKTVLDNGIKIITEYIPYFHSASLGIWVDAGVKNETRANNGISHFIEHLMFKGTKNRSAQEIAELMDSIGGNLNAFTEKEQTCYYAKVVDKYVPLAMEILSDMLLNSNFAPDDIEKEKGVIMEEVKMYEDSPEEVVFDLFNQTLLNTHPFGFPTIGRKSFISKAKRNDFLKFMQSFYVPENIIVAAAGKVKHNQIIKLVEKLLPLKPHSSQVSDRLKAEVHKVNLTKFRKCEQVYLCLGGEGVSQKDNDKYKFFILDSILGGSMSSRLFQEIREKEGLVYSIFTYMSAYKEKGLFGVHAGTSKQNLNLVMKLVADILNNIIKHGVKEEEINRAKEHIKGSIYLALESTSNRMMRLAKSEFYHDRLIPHEEIIAKIEKVSGKEVHALAKKILNPGSLSTVILGPLKDKEVNYVT
jgi:predicted Zn-dependent peptidase